MEKRGLIGLFFAVVILFLVGGVFAIPQTFSVHGKLSNSSGVLEGTYEMNFSIYEAYSGGTALWNSLRNVTTDSDGIYDVVLAGVDLNFSGQYYLGVKVESDAEMTPRINLSSSPYAFRAENVSVAGVEFTSNVDFGAYNVTVGTNTLFVDASSGRVGVGTITPIESLDVVGNVTLSEYLKMSGTTVISLDGGESISVGEEAGVNSTSSFSTLLGRRAGYKLTTGAYNTLIGHHAGNDITTGIRNTFVGGDAGASCGGGASSNVAIGYDTGLMNKGSYNTFVGAQAGMDADSTGSYNTFLGSAAGYNNLGNSSVFIGYQAGLNEAGSDKLYIDNSNTASPLIYGEFDNDILVINGDVGIGIAAPSASLHVVGTGNPDIRSEASSGDSYMTVLATAGNSANLRTSAGSSWWSMGIDGTDSDKFKITTSSSVETQEKFVIDTGGKVGIGTITPQNKLEVNGSINISGSGAALIFPDGTSMTTATDGDASTLDGIDSTFFMPLNTSVVGDFDFNGGWESGGFSISGGDIYAQTGWFYNISSLEVTHLEVNGSLFPDVDNQFDVGYGTFRWRDLYLSGEVLSAGTGDSYFMGDVGIGTTSPQNTLNVIGDVNATGNLSLGSGKIQYNDTSNKYVYYNTTEWQELGTGSGGSVPVNTISAFNQATCPAGWILANGTSGTPDLRGIFIRGAGTSGSYQMANGTNFSATYGEYQDDSMQGHRHASSVDGISLYHTGNDNKGVSAGAVDDVSASFAVQDPTTDGTHGTPRTGAETAPASYALIYCMKTSDDSQETAGLLSSLGDNVYLTNVSKNFGIGTSVPNQELEVSGSINVTNQIIINDGASSSSPSIVFSDDSNTGMWDGGSPDYLAFTTGGDNKVGIWNNGLAVFPIGSVSAPQLHHNADSNSGIYWDRAGGVSLIGDGLEILKVNGPTGNVGIGTASPQNKLEVNGSINISGSNAVLIFPDGTNMTTGSSGGIWTNVSEVATYYGDVNITGDLYVNESSGGKSFAE